MIRSGFFSQYHTLRNADLISHRGHYFDVITEEKVKASKKKNPKNHVLITNKAKAHFRSSYTGEADPKNKNPPKKTWHFPLSLCFLVDSLQSGAKYKHFYLVQTINVITKTGYKINGVNIRLPPKRQGYQPSSSSLSFMVMPWSPPPSETEAVASSTVNRLCRVS